MSSSVPKVKLSDGTEMPSIGFGSGTALWRQECVDIILKALHNGYRYLDTAQQYRTSEYVGEAIKKWGGKREELYIVTKFGGNGADGERNDPRAILQDELKKLGVDYVDLYLVHNPFYAAGTQAENWKIMESLKADGLTKSIGVSNYREEDILELKEAWTHPPVVNQIEFNPYVYHAPNMQRLIKLCNAENIHIECYGPLNSLFRSTDGPVDPIVKRIAKSKGGTESQVLLAWAHQFSGGPVVTTSRDNGRQKEQLEAITKVSLSKEEVQEIAEAGKGRFYRHFQGPVWNAAKP